MDFKVKIVSILLVILLGSMIGLVGYDQIAKDTLIIEKNAELEIRVPVSDYENRMLAEQLIDLVIENYDKSKSKVDPLEFKLINGEIRYVFVLDRELTVIAHPIPELMGNTFDNINAVRTFEEINSELVSEKQTWVNYSVLNPNSGQVENKKSLFKLHDGLVFGSGFYN